MHAQLFESCPTLCDPMDYTALQAPLPMGCSGKNTSLPGTWIVPLSSLSRLSHVSRQLSQYLSAQVQVHIIMAPKRKSSDAGSLDVPKRSQKMLP